MVGDPVDSDKFVFRGEYHERSQGIIGSEIELHKRDILYIAFPDNEL